MQQSLGFRSKGRKVIGADEAFELRKMLPPYGMTDHAFPHF
jgi:hypothetical protein